MGLTFDKTLSPKGFSTFSGLEKKILVAPLNWGLGHATRCIPIIKALLKNGFMPIIASDGDALLLLKKEFPQLPFYELPAYNIIYSKGKNQKLKLFLQSKKIIKAAKEEQLTIGRIHKKEKLSGIIADNRFGVRLKELPSVYITHQINVLSGSATNISSAIHQKIMRKFSVCWVPDYTSDFKLSGKLSAITSRKLNIEYIGALSRFKKKKVPKHYEILILLSGPEPQRSLLETKLLNEFKYYDKKVLLVRGIFTTDSLKTNNKNIEVKNHLLTKDLENAINSSKLILCRSGYSTILDMAKLQKKVFFIPTPGQYEQEYLAAHLQRHKIAPYATQAKFFIDKLSQTRNFKGFSGFKEQPFSPHLFKIF